MRKQEETRRYGEKASEKVERALHEMDRGELKSEVPEHVCAAASRRSR